MGERILTRLILVRHCQAEGNLKKFFQGTIDSDITPLGEEQIEKTALLLKDEPIDIMYTSSKLRARRSAEGINKYHDVELITDDRIVEIDAGSWEGVQLTEIEKEYPQQFSDWRNAPERFQAPGGESMQQVYDRVNPAIMSIVEKNKGKTICVVSHGCAIKNMMCFLHGWGIERIREVEIGMNMSVNIIEFDDELKPHIIVERYTEHLQ